MKNDLKRKNSAQWILHSLSAQEKRKRLDVVTLLKQRFGIEGLAFLNRIVALDETWVKDFELELKSQSKDWRCPDSSRPKNFRRAQTKVHK